jgi:hypothetical protein
MEFVLRTAGNSAEQPANHLPPDYLQIHRISLQRLINELHH